MEATAGNRDYVACNLLKKQVRTILEKKNLRFEEREDTDGETEKMLKFLGWEQSLGQSHIITIRAQLKVRKGL